MKFLFKLWYQRHPLYYCLLPFTWIYQAAACLKRYGYQIGLCAGKKLPVSVIVVGNLTVGGTGKTPVVIALAQYFQSKGWRVGVISRGYGGKSAHYPLIVTATSDPKQAGDEPVFIAKATKCPVIVAPKRVDAAAELLKQNINLIISDDGLQHYALKRDIEIAVLDGERRLGNGWCLPAGPLREPPSRLRHVNFILCNGGEPQIQEYRFTLRPGSIYNLKNLGHTLNPAQFNQPLHAVAGIGHPQRFFQQLRTLGFAVIEHPYPDHHVFTRSDIDFGANELVIMTEKDAVKCIEFADERHWCLPVTAELTPKFWTDLDAQLLRIAPNGQGF